MRYTLIEDAVSYTKGRIYASKGDEVTLVRDCGNVAIVQDAKGQRFPISKNKINLTNEITNQTQETAPSVVIDNGNKPVVQRRDKSPGKKGSGKAETNPALIQPTQKALW